MEIQTKRVLQRPFCWLAFGIWLSLALSSCATIDDGPVCLELNVSKGYCVHTLSDKAFYVDDKNKFENKTWWEMRRTNVQVPASYWAKIKAFIIKSCKNNKHCDSVISSWDRSSSQIDKKIDENVKEFSGANDKGAFDRSDKPDKGV